MEEDVGLRERKKRETRRSLSEVATRLFAEHGFEEVKISEIAAAANVSEKTVFNYFPTKEDLILEGCQEVQAELVRAVQERAPGESVLVAARRHTLALAERMNALPAWRRAAFRKIVQSSPSVQTRLRQISAQYEEQLAELLTKEAAPGDTTPYVVARVIGVLVHLGFGGATWSDTKRRTHAEHLSQIEAAFLLLSKGLADYGIKKDSGC